MGKNMTLKLDEDLIRKCRKIASQQDKSVSAWVSDLIRETVSKKENYEKAKKHALKMLNEGFLLGGEPFTRDSLYQRRKISEN